MLTPEEIKALNTPLKDMTPALLVLAISAKDKQTAQIRKENKRFKPSRKKTTYVQTDCDPFTSPVTGEVIGGKSQLREHLKVTNCRLVEPSETKHLRKEAQ